MPRRAWTDGTARWRAVGDAVTLPVSSKREEARTMWIRELTPAECTEVLAAHRLAHLACSMDGHPYVVTIHYAHADNALYAFSLPGKKIECMRANALVAALVEVQDRGRGWKSVIVNGRYEELPDRIGFKRQLDRAWSLLSTHANWWEPGALKPGTPEPQAPMPPVFFRILIDEISGREARQQA
jgi:uncharacterized protein